MSITAESAKEHANDPAVFCCRAEAGITIEPGNLEDPALFEDLVDSGLLVIPDNVLTVGQALGAKLLKTTDALIPITPEIVEGSFAENNSVKTTIESTTPTTEETNQNNESTTPANIASVTSKQINTGSVGEQQFVKIQIAEGKGISLEFPISVGIAATSPVVEQGSILPSHTKDSPIPTDNSTLNANQEDKAVEPVKIRSFIRKHFKIENVKIAEETKIEGTTLYLRTPDIICKEAMLLEELVVSLKLDIITPADYGKYSETIMDVQPIATKEEGDLGHGITRILDGVVIILTGTDEVGRQIGEFGSSEGELERNIMWGRPGAPDKGEIFIKAEAVVVEGTTMERRGPLAVHKAVDYITEEIRKALKVADESLVINSEEVAQYRRPGQKRILIIKEIMGQGAMHDNLIMPVEPVGTLGGKPNVDLGNLPVMLAPTEVLDGGIHALTCIGPASKETSRHYFREPLITEAMNDSEVDLVGVMFVGSPQANAEKFYVSKRLGITIEAMNIDGVIVTTEGFGNNHIDFSSHIEEIGSRGISVVGETYSAVQGALVVGNQYMDALIDNNKSMQGIENEILSNNTICKEDGIRALAMLKTKMGGGSIKKAERKWNPNVKQNNIEVVEKKLGIKIDLVENEQSLPKSKKRQTVYEKE